MPGKHILLLVPVLGTGKIRCWDWENYLGSLHGPWKRRGSSWGDSSRLKLDLDKMNYPLQSPFITSREAAQEFSSDLTARWLGWGEMSHGFEELHLCIGQAPRVDVLLSIQTNIRACKMQEIRVLKLCGKLWDSQGWACISARPLYEEFCGAFGSLVVLRLFTRCYIVVI